MPTKDFFEKERIALEQATGGKNTLLYDDLGYPSVMVKIPRFMLGDVYAGAPFTPHPAFIVNGVVKDHIYISKYINTVEFDRGYSLADKNPTSYVTFDQAVNYCKNKGAGWHLMSNAEWSAIALWCRQNGTIPRGNNLAGCDISNRLEAGTRAEDYGPFSSNWNNRCVETAPGTFLATGKTKTGTGPDTWNHDLSSSGIADLNGNMWEWQNGFRLINGEIQIITNNDSATFGVDVSPTSNLWKAVLQDGSLVPPGTANTLHINGTATGNASQSAVNLGGAFVFDIKRDNPFYTGLDTNDDFAYAQKAFETLSVATGVTVPDILKYLGVYPDGSGNSYDGNYFWIRNNGERLPIRGGDWGNGTNAGVFALDLINSRDLSFWYVGFRSAFC